MGEPVETPSEEAGAGGQSEDTTEKQPGHLVRMARFISAHRLYYSGVVLAMVLAGFFGFGVTRRWGADQWGPFSEWVAGALTLAAVVVALRESLRGQRESLNAQHTRLVDHELTRRRENLNAMADLWAALMVINMPTLKFRVYFENLPRTFDPNVARTDLDPDATDQPLAFEVGTQYETFIAKWTETIEPPLFVALALLQGTPFDEAVKQLNQMLADFKTKELPKLTATLPLGVRPDTTSLREAWVNILGMRQTHLDLARKHFSLDLDDVQVAIDYRSEVI
jgi:hypothetical protein